MTYEDKLKIYKEEYDIGGYGIEGKDRFKLLSLVCMVTKALRSKTPDLSVLTVLQKIMKDETDSQLLEVISLQCESLIRPGYRTEFDTYGFTKASDMVAEIKRLILEWLPF